MHYLLVVSSSEANNLHLLIARVATVEEADYKGYDSSFSVIRS